MSPGEAFYRAGTKLRCELDRGGSLLKPFASASPVTETGFERRLRDALRTRFYLGVFAGDRDAARSQLPAACVASAVGEADRLCRHHVEVLGHGEHDLGPVIDWHRDPVTGRKWELRYWADYDPVGDCAPGDVKRVHEINRHQHLPRLAKAFYLTGREEYALEAVRQLESWIEQNPPLRGINWHSSLEIALRSIAWLWTLAFLLPSQALDEGAAYKIGKSLFRQLRHVFRYPSIYTSPNTHVIGEAAALFLAGLVFDAFVEARAWREKGTRLLIESAERQVSPEGVHCEHSSYYHAYALDFYLQAAVLARRNGVDLPEAFRDCVLRMLEFLMQISRPDGSLPRIGDDDGGRALGLSQTFYQSTRDLLACGAGLYGRPDLKRAAGELPEESFWLLGRQAAKQYDRIDGRGNLATHALYPAAGYWVSRSGEGMRGTHLVFRGGGLGTPTGGHSHADALSFTFWSGGRELLVDPGTCVYNAAPEWRSFFRSTRAHNTVVVDGRDQCEAGGTFRWRSRASARILRHVVLPDVELIEAEQDGYRRLPEPIVHRRRIVRLPEDCWVVLDDLRGSGNHTFDFHYHFGPEADAAFRRAFTDGCQLEVRAPDARLRMFFVASQPLEQEMIRASLAPIQGWDSPRYGTRSPACVLRASARGTAPLVALTILMPVSTNEAELEPQAPRFVTVPVDARSCLAAVVLERESGRDLFLLAPPGGGIEAEGLSTDGEFLWVRSERGMPRRFVALEASRAAACGRTLFERPERERLVVSPPAQDEVCAESVES
jgi:hypothetical protein